MEWITIAPPLSAGFIRISWLWVLKNFMVVFMFRDWFFWVWVSIILVDFNSKTKSSLIVLQKLFIRRDFGAFLVSKLLLSLFGRMSKLLLFCLGGNWA